MKNKNNTPSNINNFKEIEAEIVEPNTPLSPKKHVFNPKGAAQTDNGTPMSQKQKISRAAIDFNNYNGKKIILNSNQNGVAQSQIMPQQAMNDQEGGMRPQSFNNGASQDPSEAYEDQR